LTGSVRPLVRDALAALGIRRLVLGVHDAAFPVRPDEDVGVGTPHAEGAEELVALAADLGFDGLQLGPHGATSASNPSPYDAALFSRNPLSVSLAALVRPERGGLVARAEVERIAAGRPGPADRVAYAYAWREVGRALERAWERFRARRSAGAAAPLAERLERFRAEHAAWLLRDALYEVLRERHGGAAWTAWPAPDRTLLAPLPGEEAAAEARLRALLAEEADAIERWAFVQLLAHAQHEEFRARCAARGLALFGDMQVGLSERDVWAAQRFLLSGWRMGAPPSRTDSGGQAWGFAVLDPRAYREADGGDGPALRFVRARAAKMHAEYDGVRVDHPHGLVTPWVYRDGGDPAAAVRAGARLFDSPGVPEYPELAAFAVARPEQIDRSLPRHADGWVRALDDAQVARYAVLLDAVLAGAAAREDVACEILSTHPYPLRRAVERHGLGRFRITQKADLDRADDVYRGENARPEDWIMLGSHDTLPIRPVAARWVADGSARRRAERLAARLVPEPAGREAFARAAAASDGALAQASFAELFLGPARQVFVYFTDLLGETAPYNVPGSVSAENWSLRIPPDVRARHRARCAEGAAPSVPRALAAALRARGGAFAAAHAGLASALEAADPASGSGR
jgi:4-alpha-glucanotransferase